jgi:hypothetical protein
MKEAKACTNNRTENVNKSINHEVLNKCWCKAILIKKKRPEFKHAKDSFDVYKILGTADKTLAKHNS